MQYNRRSIRLCRGRFQTCPYGGFVNRPNTIRLKGYDYSQAGAYFITICTKDRECLFGDVVDGKMQLNAYGRIVYDCWHELPNHYPAVKLDAFVVMPSHIHGIIVIVGAGFKPAPISEIVRGFKTFSARLINKTRNTQCRGGL